MILAALLLQAAAPLPFCDVIRERGPSRRITGVWVDWFESSRFVEGIADPKDIDWHEYPIWLDMPIAVAHRARGARRSDDYHYYWVTFDGYRERVSQQKGCLPVPDIGTGSYKVEHLVASSEIGTIQDPNMKRDQLR